MTEAHPGLGFITSRNHAAIKRIRGLQTRQERDRSRLVFVEGVRFIAEAVQLRAPIERVLVAPQLLSSPFGKKLVRQILRKGTPCLQVTPEVFHSIASADDPQGVGAVVRQQWEPLPRPRPDDGLCWIALSHVHSPGNLGTIIRTCDAVGAAGVLFLGGDPDPYDPSCVRATMGAVFSQRFVRTSLGELIAWKRRHGAALVGTSPAGAADYQAMPYPSPLVLFMGSERRGLSEEEKAVCDRLVRIPMVGRSDSLNLAIATSVMLYEVFNQRRTEEGAALPR
jgi:RNA methyltransferase, TrmH family